ncbi:hypothetical protein M3Y99_01687800 [Aphelenchoides fujianensis]|nr:hypothetical protein M3Y99_01687800 [Aphelenchoides fujianensis]
MTAAERRLRSHKREAAKRKPLAAINPPANPSTDRSKSRSSSKSKKSVSRRTSVATSRGSEVENEAVELGEQLANVQLSNGSQALEIQKQRFDAAKQRILARIHRETIKKKKRKKKKGKRPKRKGGRRGRRRRRSTRAREKIPLPFNPPVYRPTTFCREREHTVRTPAGWLSAYTERRMNEIIDVNEQERNLMLWWNETLMRSGHRVITKEIGNRLLASPLVDFARDRAPDILSEAGGGIRNFLCHAKVTRDRGFVDETAIRSAVRLLLQVVQSSREQPAAPNGVLEDQTARPLELQAARPPEEEQVATQKEVNLVLTLL